MNRGFFIILFGGVALAGIIFTVSLTQRPAPPRPWSRLNPSAGRP